MKNKNNKKNKKKSLPVNKVVPKKKIKKEKKIKEKRKINIKKTFIFLLCIYLLYCLVSSILNFKIRNIVISNNTILTDQEIIEKANLSKYPSFFKTFKKTIENRLLKDSLIKDVKVYKRINGEIEIEVFENYPLFYNSSKSTTVLLDGREVKKKYISPFLINYIPDNVYPVFVEKMKKLNNEVLRRTSEIKYSPNEVDDSRFMFYMTDGNYVYLTLSKFDLINDYVNIMENIIAKFGNKNGILNLDAGGYFDLIE